MITLFRKAAASHALVLLVAQLEYSKKQLLPLLPVSEAKLMKGLAVSFAFLVVGPRIQSLAASPPTVTSCSKNGFCYCVQQSLVDAVGRKLTDIREAIKLQKQAGKAIGLSKCPAFAGSFDVNLQVAAEIKKRDRAAIRHTGR
jgi:hypothetical protein